MEKLLVSIIVPVYGVEQYLKECTDSILAQTYQDLEIILIDDASPDNCGAICDEYAARDNRVKVIHKKNGGAASARNAGLEIARGDYICFVDGDDTISPDYIEILLQKITGDSADIAVCGFTQFSKAGKTICKQREPSGGYDQLSYLRLFLHNWTCALLWNKIFRKEVIGSIRMEEGHRIDDEFFTYQVVMNAKKIVVFDTPLYNYRLRASSVMQNVCANGGQILLDRIQYMQQRYAHICDRVPELKPEFFADMVDSYTRYWSGCAQLPKARKQINNWKKNNWMAVVLSNLTLKQKLIYIHALFFKKAGRKDLNEHKSFPASYLFE